MKLSELEKKVREWANKNGYNIGELNSIDTWILTKSTYGGAKNIYIYNIKNPKSKYRLEFYFESFCSITDFSQIDRIYKGLTQLKNDEKNLREYLKGE